MAETRKSQAGNKKGDNFGDFFECSDIDNQDYSQFINDQSQFIIGQNGELVVELSRKNTCQDENVDDEDNQPAEDMLIEIKEIIIREDKENLLREVQLQECNNNRNELVPFKANEEQKGNLNQSSKTKQKKTRETMMIEPLPIFDCMYCVKSCKMIFQKMSEHYLSNKYARNMKPSNDDFNHHRLSEDLEDERIETLLHTKNTFSIVESDVTEAEIQSQWLQDSFDLHILISKLPIQLQQQRECFSHDISPIGKNNKDTILLTNITQFIHFPTLKVSNESMDPIALYLKNKLSSQIIYSRAMQNNSQANPMYDQNYLTSPTLMAQEQYISQIHPLMFNTINGTNQCNNFMDRNSCGNFVKDLILEEEQFGFDEPVSITKWAKTNRQKILVNISFESDQHNIYDPKFSSQCSERSLSSIERSVYDDCPNIEIQDSMDNYSSNSSTPSVAEERDTISLTPNAITPNLSRIMNICSISKIEQPSIITQDSNSTPLGYKNPKSSLSYHHNQKSKKGLYFEKSGLQKSTPANRNPDILIKEQKYKQIAAQQRKSEANVPYRGNSGFNTGMTIGNLNYQNLSMVNSVQSNNVQNYITETNDSLNIINSQANMAPYQQFLKPLINRQQLQNRTATTKSSSCNFKKSMINKRSIEKFQLNTQQKQRFEQLTLDTQYQQPSLLNRNSSNKLFQLEQSSMFNPYETQQNTPHHNLFDHKNTSTYENRISILTNGGGTEVKKQTEVSVTSQGQKSSKSVMRNSQSMSNLNLQPRTFITRNVKIRKNHPTNSVANAVVTEVHTPQHLQQIHLSKNISQQINSEIQSSPCHQTQQQMATQKKEQKLQIKRQRLARDILLSKVYNSNLKEPQQFIINTHKKTNTTLSNGNSLKASVSRPITKSSNKKSSLQIDPQGVLVAASAQDLQGYFNKNSDTKRFLKIITKSQTKSVAQTSYNTLPAFNNFLK